MSHGLPDRHGRADLGAGDEGQAAARVTERHHVSKPVQSLTAAWRPSPAATASSAASWRRAWPRRACKVAVIGREGRCRRRESRRDSRERRRRDRRRRRRDRRDGDPRRLRRGDSRVGARRHPDQCRRRQRPGRAQRRTEHLRRADGRVRRGDAPEPARHGRADARVRATRWPTQGSGCIVNISSMARARSRSRGVLGYSVAKAGIDNFTRWLAVDLARRYGDGMRVNAVAPGFFLGKQNRALLVNADGEHAARPHHRRAHADGPVRRRRGTHRRGSLVVQRRRVVRHRGGRSG